MAATDPANPYGAMLPWSRTRSGRARAHRTITLGQTDTSATTPIRETPANAGRGPTRSVGATVILVNGALAAYLARGDRQLVVNLPESEPERSRTGRAVAHALIDRARTVGNDGRRGMLIEEIDGVAPTAHPLAPYLAEAGFVAGALGFQPSLRP